MLEVVGGRFRGKIGPEAVVAGPGGVGRPADATAAAARPSRRRRRRRDGARGQPRG